MSDYWSHPILWRVSGCYFVSWFVFQRKKEFFEPHHFGKPCSWTHFHAINCSHRPGNESQGKDLTGGMCLKTKRVRIHCFTPCFFSRKRGGDVLWGNTGWGRGNPTIDNGPQHPLCPEGRCLPVPFVEPKYSILWTEPKMSFFFLLILTTPHSFTRESTAQPSSFQMENVYTATDIVPYLELTFPCNTGRAYSPSIHKRLFDGFNVNLLHWHSRIQQSSQFNMHNISTHLTHRAALPPIGLNLCFMISLPERTHWGRHLGLVLTPDL